MSRVVLSVLSALLSFTFCFPCIASADWAKRVAGPQGVDAIPTSIGLDGAGNVYVAGRFFADPTEPTYVVMKYDGNGDRKWLNRQRGFALYTTLPTMAVDRNGNVYLLGTSRNQTHAMITIKYGADGNQSWLEHFPGESSDIYPCNLATNGEGVYVTGTSEQLNGEYTRNEIVTIKYDNSGALEWTARYKDPTNARLRSLAIAVDNHGNVYIEGVSWGHADGTTRFVTMKYSADGSLQWKRVYRNAQPAGLNCMVVDSNGNVYLAGIAASTSGRWDLVTLKYDTLGTRQWTRKYNGPEDPNERPRDMTVDVDGNVYVTGFSWRNDILLFRTFTVKYDTSGVRQWVNTFSWGGHERYATTPSISVDGSGNAYLITSDDHVAWADIATVKINSNGVQEWVKTYNGRANRSDYGEGIALDESGSIYVIGESTGPDGSDDIVTIKYEQ